jgi:electron transport complex protein RnfG
VSLLRAISRNGLLLGVFATVTGILIATTWTQTRDDIARSIRAAEARQLLEIFPKGTHDNDMVEDHFTVSSTAALLGLREDRLGYIARRGEAIVGVILPATARDGYSGDIDMLVGITGSGDVAGVRVVSHRETPGLGDAIDLKKSNWVLGFDDTSLRAPAKDHWLVKKDGGDFDQFTGATVTPRAVVVAVRKALEYTDVNQNSLFGVEEENSLE